MEYNVVAGIVGIFIILNALNLSAGLCIIISRLTSEHNDSYFNNLQWKTTFIFIAVLIFFVFVEILGTYQYCTYDKKHLESIYKSKVYERDLVSFKNKDKLSGSMSGDYFLFYGSMTGELSTNNTISYYYTRFDNNINRQVVKREDLIFGNNVSIVEDNEYKDKPLIVKYEKIKRLRKGWILIFPVKAIEKKTGELNYYFYIPENSIQLQNKLD